MLLYPPKQLFIKILQTELKIEFVQCTFLHISLVSELHHFCVLHCCTTLTYSAEEPVFQSRQAFKIEDIHFVTLTVIQLTGLKICV